MRTPLLEIYAKIPDHRRVEGRRFDLATVLLYSNRRDGGGANFLPGKNAMSSSPHPDRQSLQRSALRPRIALCASYTGLRLILHGVDPGALESALSAPTPRRRSPSRPRP